MNNGGIFFINYNVLLLFIDIIWASSIKNPFYPLMPTVVVKTFVVYREYFKINPIYNSGMLTADLIYVSDID